MTREVLLGSVVEAVATRDPSRSGNADFVYVDLSSVDQDTKTITSPRTVVSAEAPSRARQVIRHGDVLVATVRPNLNSVAFVPEDLGGAIASTGFTVLRPGAGLDGRYLFHWVRSPRFVADMVKKATGASYPAVSDRIVRESLLPLPEFAEQRRIAAMLDQVDDLRAKRRAALERVAQVRAALLDTCAHPNRTKSCRVGDVADVQTGPFGSLLHQADYQEGGVPLVNPMHIVDGRIRPDPRSAVRRDKWEALRAYHLRAGDVVLARRGEMGRTAVVTETDAGLLCGTGSLIVRPRAGLVHPEYLSAMLSSPRSRERLLRVSLGTTLPNLNSGIVEAFEVPVPTLEAQLAFAEAVSGLERLRARMDRSLDVFGALADSVANRAFKGEL